MPLPPVPGSAKVAVLRGAEHLAQQLCRFVEQVQEVRVLVANQRLDQRLNDAWMDVAGARSH
jgi:hypothetical protein